MIDQLCVASSPAAFSPHMPCACAAMSHRPAAAAGGVGGRPAGVCRRAPAAAGGRAAARGRRVKVLPPLVAFFKKIGKSHITHPDPGHRFTARAGPAGMGLHTCVKVFCDLLPF